MFVLFFDTECPTNMAILWQVWYWIYIINEVDNGQTAVNILKYRYVYCFKGKFTCFEQEMHQDHA